MRIQYSTFIFLSFVLCLGASALAQDLENGKALYATCVACHGKNGEGIQALGTPRIAGQHGWYLRLQLDNFKSGLRGYHKEDTFGSQMRAIIPTLKGEKAVEDVVAYIGTLKAPLPESTFEADLMSGKILYRTCRRCHGKKAEGREKLKTPKLSEQHDWYMLRQLMNYRKDFRGTHPKDNYGGRMWGIARTIEDEQALKDIVAYISSLP